MPRTDAEASLTAFCAASSQLFGDSVRTSITLIRAMMVPPESAWAACPMSSTVHEDDRCAMIAMVRLSAPPLGGPPNGAERQPAAPQVEQRSLPHASGNGV